MTKRTGNERGPDAGPTAATSPARARDALAYRAVQVASVSVVHAVMPTVAGSFSVWPLIASIMIDGAM